MDKDSLLKEAIDLLRKLGWVEGDTPIDPGECPLCAATESHWDGCPLGRFLEKVSVELKLERTPFGPNWDDPKYSQLGHRESAAQDGGAMNETPQLKRAQSLLAHLLTTRDAMLRAIEELATAIAAAVQEVTAASEESA